MDVQAGGASAVVLSGSPVSAVLKISGASSVKAFDFETEDVVVKCSGASKAEIFATNTIAVTASGPAVVLRAIPGIVSHHLPVLRLSNLINRAL